MADEPSYARLAKRDPPSLLQRLGNAILKRREGKVPHTMGILGYHPRLLAAFMAFMGILEGATKVPPRLKRLVHLRVAMRIGCPT